MSAIILIFIALKITKTNDTAKYYQQKSVCFFIFYHLFSKNMHISVSVCNKKLAINLDALTKYINFAADLQTVD